MLFNICLLIIVSGLSLIDWFLIKKYKKDICFFIKSNIFLLQSLTGGILLVSAFFSFFGSFFSFDLNHEVLLLVFDLSLIVSLLLFLDSKIISKNIKYLPLIFLPVLWLYFLHNKVIVRLQSFEDTSIQVFFDIGKKYNDLESETISIKKSDFFKDYEVNFPFKKVRGFRIDPSENNLAIESIGVGNPFVSYKYKGSELNSIISSPYQIQVISNDKGVSLFPTGDDPHFEIKNIPPLKVSFELKLTIVLLFTLVLILIVKLVFLVINKIFAKKTKDISKKFFTSILIIVFSWFAFQIIYFGLNIKFGIFPDEQDHFTRIEYFSAGQSTLKSSFELLKKDPLNTIFPFYHFLFGKSLSFVIFLIPTINSLFFLRISNIVLSLVNFFISYLLVKEVTKNKLIQISTLLMQTNILMFTFISSGISYDNIINLLANFSIFFLIKLLKTPSKKIFLFLLILVNILGFLTKITFVPLILIEFFIFLIFIKKIFNKKIYSILAIFIFIVLILINYKIISYISNSFVLHSKININNPYIKNFKDFTFDYFQTIEERTFGILAHQNMFKGTSELVGYHIIFIISFILFLSNIKKIFKNKNILIISIVSIFYITVQFLYNYTQGYLSSGLFGSALQGRYNFPILTSFLIVLNYSLLFKFNNKIKLFIVLLITFFLVKNGFFWFISNAGPEWYII